MKKRAHRGFDCMGLFGGRFTIVDPAMIRIPSVGRVLGSGRVGPIPTDSTEIPYPSVLLGQVLRRPLPNHRGEPGARPADAIMRGNEGASSLRPNPQRRRDGSHSRVQPLEAPRIFKPGTVVREVDGRRTMAIFRPRLKGKPRRPPPFVPSKGRLGHPSMFWLRSDLDRDRA